MVPLAESYLIHNNGTVLQLDSHLHYKKFSDT